MAAPKKQNPGTRVRRDTPLKLSLATLSELVNHRGDRHIAATINSAIDEAVKDIYDRPLEAKRRVTIVLDLEPIVPEGASSAEGFVISAKAKAAKPDYQSHPANCGLSTEMNPATQRPEPIGQIPPYLGDQSIIGDDPDDE